MSARKCQERVYAGAFSSNPCGATAKVERNGKHYCGRHDPVAVQAKRDAKHAAWDEEWRTKQKQQIEEQAARDEMKRRAECFPDLLAALQACRGQWIHSVNAEQCLAAIAKATGEQS